jgi:hypothetical protein
MKARLVISAALLGSLPALSYAQPAPPPVAKATPAQASKVLNAIANDKAKLKTYCDIARINQQMVEADKKKDGKALQALGEKADRLEEALGPDYVGLMLGLEELDPNSADGKAVTAAFASADKKCQ